MGVVIQRFQVYLTALDPTRGAEIQKTRPCLVISPDEMNRHIATVIITPMTTRRRGYPTRVPIRFQGQDGEIALDQIRALDKRRLVKPLGEIDERTKATVLATLQEMFL